MSPDGNHHDRVASAETLIFGLVCVLAAGAALLRIVGKQSASRRLHGKFVFGWMVVGWVVGSCVGVYMVGYPGCYTDEADIGSALFGLLGGWLLGMLHGGIVLWRQRRRTI